MIHAKYRKQLVVASFITRIDSRSKGHGKKIWKPCMDAEPGKNVILNCACSREDLYMKIGFYNLHLKNYITKPEMVKVALQGDQVVGCVCLRKYSQLSQRLHDYATLC